MRNKKREVQDTRNTAPRTSPGLRCQPEPLENFEQVGNSGLIYSRFEAYRCLAEVRFRRGELDEAESLCVAASQLVSGSESRVSKLWLGPPLYIEVFVAASKEAELAAREAEAVNDNVRAISKRADAAAKRAKAAEHLAQYEELVEECQSPRFKREAERLKDLVTTNAASACFARLVLRFPFSLSPFPLFPCSPFPLPILIGFP